MLNDQFEMGHAPVVPALVRINSRQLREVLELNYEFGGPSKPVDQTIMELLAIGLEEQMDLLAKSRNDE